MQTIPSLMFIANRPQVTFVRGSGSWLFDQDDRPYLDFVQGWAVNSLGHSPQIVRDALAVQAARVINVSPAYYNDPMCRLAEVLAGLSGLNRVFFANSGAEANEGAIKLARKWGTLRKSGAYEIVVFEGAFHGRTLATMSASGKPQWKALYEPKVSGFVRVPRERISAVEQVIGPKTAAVMLEPIQGEAGVIPFSHAFLRDLRQLTRDRSVLLVLDEIQTGVGRTGQFFCFEHSGILPDVVTLGKGIGSGVPLSALLAKEDFCLFEPGDQGGTYNGNALMTSVGEAVVREVARPDFLAGVRESGAYLAESLRRLSADCGFGEVRGQGLLLALDLRRENATSIVDRALANGLLINSPAPTILRFMPALNVTREEIDQMIQILNDVVRDVAVTSAARDR